ncbi:unnamed protein product [Leuciscus chuanchicus]
MQDDAIPAIPSVLTSEVRHAIQNIQKDRAPGLDGIEAELLKEVLLYKKGDREQLRNYRPIWLLPTVYKVFTKVLYNQLARQLDEQQPPEQAGFRSGYSTMDHIHVLNQLLERCRKYKMPLVLAFVDYEKAFDSIEMFLRELNSGCATNITLFDWTLPT